MHVYTSIAANYLPKARVLARTLKRFHPDARMSLVVADAPSRLTAADGKLFDDVLTLADLPLPRERAWLFRHSVVELCTAVKGPAAGELLRRSGGPLFYFDPDIALLAPLGPLVAEFERHAVLLTPHSTIPETSLAAIDDNEIAPLIYGAFNLGFLGLRDPDSAAPFVNWWTQRLLHYCYACPERGLFTDQRWVDLAPGFFPEIGIVRGLTYNVATWNLSHRRVTGAAPFELRINGEPLVFFHFSGLDSGHQEIMLHRYGGHSPVLFDLRRWYLAECAAATDGPRQDWAFARYDDGTPITPDMRRLYREMPGLAKRFPDPFRTGRDSYLEFYRQTAPESAEDPAALRLALAHARARLVRLESGALRRFSRGISRVCRHTLGRLFRRAG